uniref:uncharacterized protein LOC120348430 n=1 Tax=Styela clava TaxID=7725 RepID=UPI001939A79B|nr:uncharacterized protein LOC120348430 [Styela clava]
MKLFKALVLTAMLFGTGFAIECYVCHQCNDAVQLTDLKILNCSSVFRTCTKSSVNGEVTRSCSVGGTIGCTRGSTEGATGEACICQGDRCNESKEMKSTIYIVLTVILIIVKFII